MSKINVNFEHIGIDTKEIMKEASKVEEIHNELNSKKDDEKEFLGWMNLASNYEKKEIEKIKKAARKIRKDS